MDERYFGRKWISVCCKNRGPKISAPKQQNIPSMEGWSFVKVIKKDDVHRGPNLKMR